jgi:hypothetical protein
MKKAQRQVKRRMVTLLAIASLAALLLVAAPAGAATSAQQGYSEPGARVQQQVTDPQASSNADPNSSLPFTGLDVVAILMVGSVLLAAGIGVRKLSTSAS